MPTYVTWTSYYKGVTQLTNVHILKEDIQSTGHKRQDDHLLAGTVTKCGHVLKLLNMPYIVKSHLKRPCKHCFGPQNKLAEVKGTMAFKVNFKGVASGFTPHDAGDVDGTLISHELQEATKNSGNPGLLLVWSENDSPNKKIYKTYSLMPQSLWSLKRDLIHMGADVEEMNDEDADLEQIVTSLYGRVHTIQFGDPRPYTDKNGQPAMGDNMLGIKDPTK